MPTTTNYGWTTPADPDLVKDGSYRGFSIEGKFAGFENLMSKQNNMDLVALSSYLVSSI